MKRYLTEYDVTGTKYGGDIWACSPKHAEQLAAKRGLGEKVVGYGRKTGGLKKPVTLLEKLHEAVYLSWIGMESGLLTAEDALGDKSVVHEMIHTMVSKRVRPKDLEKRFRDLQKRIPGHKP